MEQNNKENRNKPSDLVYKIHEAQSTSCSSEETISSATLVSRFANCEQTTYCEQAQSRELPKSKEDVRPKIKSTGFRGFFKRFSRNKTKSSSSKQLKKSPRSSPNVPLKHRHIRKLIGLYYNHNSLYNPTNPHYGNKNIDDICYLNISRHFRHKTSKDIESYIYELRQLFEREFSILENARLRYGEILKPSIKYYNEFLFLVPYLDTNFESASESELSESEEASASEASIHTKDAKTSNVSRSKDATEASGVSIHTEGSRVSTESRPIAGNNSVLKHVPLKSIVSKNSSLKKSVEFSTITGNQLGCVRRRRRKNSDADLMKKRPSSSKFNLNKALLKKGQQQTLTPKESSAAVEKKQKSVTPLESSQNLEGQQQAQRPSLKSTSDEKKPQIQTDKRKSLTIAESSKNLTEQERDSQGQKEPQLAQRPSLKSTKEEKKPQTQTDKRKSLTSSESPGNLTEKEEGAQGQLAQQQELGQSGEQQAQAQSRRPSQSQPTPQTFSPAQRQQLCRAACNQFSRGPTTQQGAPAGAGTPVIAIIHLNGRPCPTQHNQNARMGGLANNRPGAPRANNHPVPRQGQPCRCAPQRQIGSPAFNQRGSPGHSLPRSPAHSLPGSASKASSYRVLTREPNSQSGTPAAQARYEIVQPECSICSVAMTHCDPLELAQMTNKSGNGEQLQMLCDMIRTELGTAPDFLYYDAKWRIIEILREVSKRHMILQKSGSQNTGLDLSNASMAACCCSGAMDLNTNEATATQRENNPFARICSHCPYCCSKRCG